MNVKLAMISLSVAVGVALAASDLGRAQNGTECPGDALSDRAYFGHRFNEIRLHCGELTYRTLDTSNGNWSSRSYRYDLQYEADVPFLALQDGENERWLALWSTDLMFLYEGEAVAPFLRGVSETRRRQEAFYYFQDAFSASSYLTEGDVVYGPENLGSHETRKPWVEGVPGQGIGEEIHIDRWFGRLWISIGFVSYDRPELYELNSRPKTIRVVSEATGEERVVELEDTPNLQRIDVPGDWETAGDGGIRIIIEEVYPGTRWEDTAVNFIVFF
jgi:hypothetical protein